MMGTWIFDSAHTGWNELHPVLHCQKILKPVTHADLVSGNPWKSQPELSSPGRIQGLLQHFCNLSNAGSTPRTRSNQSKPENGWIIHPSVDGCAPVTN